MTDRNTIYQVVESLFEDWIDKNIDLHPLAVENMRILEADALTMLKEREAVTAKWEKRTGMMPPEYHGHYWCSNCEWHGRYNEREWEYRFCPACGAKMEGR